MPGLERSPEASPELILILRDDQEFVFNRLIEEETVGGHHLGGVYFDLLRLVDSQVVGFALGLELVEVRDVMGKPVFFDYALDLPILLFGEYFQVLIHIGLRTDLLFGELFVAFHEFDQVLVHSFVSFIEVDVFLPKDPELIPDFQLLLVLVELARLKLRKSLFELVEFLLLLAGSDDQFLN